MVLMILQKINHVKFVHSPKNPSSNLFRNSAHKNDEKTLSLEPSCRAFATDSRNGNERKGDKVKSIFDKREEVKIMKRKRPPGGRRNFIIQPVSVD